MREGLEPAHFMALFKGRVRFILTSLLSLFRQQLDLFRQVIIRRGRRRNRAAEEEAVQLFDVKAKDEDTVRKSCCVSTLHAFIPIVVFSLLILVDHVSPS